MSFGQAFDAVKEKASELIEGGNDLLGLNANTKAGNAAEGPYAKTFPNEASVAWMIDGHDWYKVFGYRFTIVYTRLLKDTPGLDGFKKFNRRQAEFQGFHFTLPIPPQSLQISPVFPSKVTATAGGVSLENSPTKFWSINMSGTTGVAVDRGGDGIASDASVNKDSERVKRTKMATDFRNTLQTTGLLSGAAGKINKFATKAGGVVDDLLEGNIAGALNTAVLPPIPYAKSSVDHRSNGFKEAQELQRFFYMYQALVSRNPKEYSLLFTNFKTDQVWEIKTPELRLLQSADDPLLYKYSMNITGWNVRSVADRFGTRIREQAAFDRFGSEGDLREVNLLSNPDILSNVLSVAGGSASFPLS